MNAENKYPALMAYIHDRDSEDSDTAYAKLRDDERIAVIGGLSEVALELERAQADFAASRLARGLTGYPYNREMGIYLGLLPLEGNQESDRGYYFASQVMHHYRFGAARREVESLLSNGAQLKTVAARDKTTGRAIRFTVFKSHQIQIEGDSVVCRNDRVNVRLSSNWSVETALQRVAEALRSGKHYGYNPERDDAPSAEVVTPPINTDQISLFA